MRSSDEPGAAHARFRRARLTKNLTIFDATARELPQIALDDALRFLLVMSEKRDPRFPRAAARLAARITTEGGLNLAESR